MFRIDDDSVTVINNGGQHSVFKFSKKIESGDAEYFAIETDPLAFAALARRPIETAIAEAGFSLERFIPGSWRGISASNIHDAYVIVKN